MFERSNLKYKSLNLKFKRLNWIFKRLNLIHIKLNSEYKSCIWLKTYFVRTHHLFHITTPDSNLSVTKLIPNSITIPTNHFINTHTSILKPDFPKPQIIGVEEAKSSRLKCLNVTRATDMIRHHRSFWLKLLGWAYNPQSESGRIISRWKCGFGVEPAHEPDDVGDPRLLRVKSVHPISGIIRVTLSAIRYLLFCASEIWEIVFFFSWVGVGVGLDFFGIDEVELYVLF